jgi:hypothetical protein
MFELKLKNDNTVLLKWGTWAMREFCQTYNITLEKYFETLGEIQKDIDKIIKLFYIGYKSACISNKAEIVFTEEDVCEWIDQIGSIYVSEGQVVDYFKYILNTINVNVSDVKDTEKKKVSKS